MLTPERLLRVMIELIFVMLGGLISWLALRGNILVDRHGSTWLILSIVLILWGLRALYKPGQWWKRWENWIRGLSLLVLGILMLAMTRVPFAWVGRMLAAIGAVLVLRGIVASTLLFRTR
jgi:drug/metabolite transporter superfamily protein YnfA